MDTICELTYDGIVFCGKDLDEVLQKINNYTIQKKNEFNELIRNTNSLGIYYYNTEHDGIEIYFSQKPAQFLIDSLSSNGWKWHRSKKCWYAKRTKRNVQLAEDICLISMNIPEQKRQRLILYAVGYLGSSWIKEYESFTTDQLLSLLKKRKKKISFSFYPKIFFHTIILKYLLTATYIFSKELNLHTIILQV